MKAHFNSCGRSKLEKATVKSKREYGGGYCGPCKLHFTRKSSLEKHKERRHKVKTSKGDYFLIDKTLSKAKRGLSKVKHNICYLCATLRNFFCKATLNKHMKKVHEGEAAQISIKGLGYISLSTEEQEKLTSRRMSCHECGKELTCIQDMKTHLRSEHDMEGYYCKACRNTFTTMSKLNLHIKTVHCKANYRCHECSSKFKTKAHLKRHRQIHMSLRKKEYKEKPENLSRRQQQRRAEQEASLMQSILNNNETLKPKIWKNVVKKNCNFLDNEDKNPLTESDVIELLQDTNVSDKKMLHIIRTLAKKWGRRETITSNIRKKLVQ